MRPVDILFPQAAKDKQAGICPFCGQTIDKGSFHDELNRREYKISGLCQACQDKMFGGDN